MIRFVLSVAVVLAIALGGGAASVWYALDRLNFETLAVGPWIAFPNRGTPDADPYSKARFSRNAELPLGQAEGLPFLAAADSSGQPLQRSCTYRVEGTVPAARFWTIYLSPDGIVPLPQMAPRWPGLHSMQILRRPDDSFEIAAGPRPHPGNWLTTSGEGPMVMVLTLYDAPAMVNPDATQVDLPQIYRLACDD